VQVKQQIKKKGQELKFKKLLGILCCVSSVEFPVVFVDISSSEIAVKECPAEM